MSKDGTVEDAIVKKGAAHLQLSKATRFQFIEENRSEFPVEIMCEVMGVSRSGYYKWRTSEPSSQKLLKAQIQERTTFHFHDNEGRFGSPKITKLLHQEGFTLTERTVSVYMAELGLRANSSRKGEGHER